MIVFEQRASTVLFNLLKSHSTPGPFLLPANICPIVPLIFFKVGRSFEFIDISTNTLCMDHHSLLDRWVAPGRDRPAGIIYVRTYGAVFDTEEVFSTIKKMSPNALIVDDRCLCEPSFVEELVAHANVALYSTGYAKFVDVGLGGVGVLGEGVPYARTVLPFDSADLLNITESYKHALIFGNEFSYTDSDWLDTSLPPWSWADYKERVKQELVCAKNLKSSINAIYSQALPQSIQFPEKFQSWRFNIHVDNKAAVLEQIRSAGLFASGHYEALDGLFGPGSGIQSRSVSDSVINLFNDRYFSVARAEHLVEVLLGFKYLSRSRLFQ